MSDELTPCYYCGLPADGTDHVVPLVVVASLMALPDVERRLRSRVLTVDACAQCNSIAGGRYFDTLAERVAFVKNRLRVKLRRDLSCKDFTPHEIAEFGPRLRDYVVAAMVRKEIAVVRLSWDPIRTSSSHSVERVLIDARRRFGKAS